MLFPSGDRLLTDVVFANRYDMVSVLVAPIDHYRDHPVAVVLRYYEVVCILYSIDLHFALNLSSKIASWLRKPIAAIAKITYVRSAYLLLQEYGKRANITIDQAAWI